MTGSTNGRLYANGRTEPSECRCPVCSSIISADMLASIVGAETARRLEIEQAFEGKFAAKEAAIRREAAAKAATDAAQKIERAERKMKVLQAGFDATLKQQLSALEQKLQKQADDRVAVIEKARFDDNQKHQQDLENLKRRTAKERPAELGERGEVDLFEMLKAAFGGENGDDLVKRVGRAVNGPDIIHRVIENHIHLGTVVYDSKNTSAWMSKWVPKIRADQKVAAADHVVLVTTTFPKHARELADIEDVVVVSPARALEVARLLRRMVVLAHRLKLSGEDRTTKTAKVYSFICSREAAETWRRVDAAVKSFIRNEQTNASHQEKSRERSLALVEQIRSAIQDDFCAEIDRIMRGLSGEES